MLLSYFMFLRFAEFSSRQSLPSSCSLVGRRVMEKVPEANSEVRGILPPAFQLWVFEE